MYDSHAHLTDAKLQPHTKMILDNFATKGGKGILNVGFSPENNLAVLKMAREWKAHPVKLYNAIGLHPELFTPTTTEVQPLTTLNAVTKALAQFEKLVDENIEEIHAIGETGLDYYHLFFSDGLSIEEKENSRELQLHSFRRHLEIALEYNLPLTIHMRDSKDSEMVYEDALKAVAEVGKGRLKGSFHSYTGPKKYVKDIIDLGFYIGVNAIVTYKNANNVRELVKEIPTDRLLLETDAPWLPPHEIRANKKLDFRMGQPSDIFIVKEYLEGEGIIEGYRENFNLLF